MLHVSFVSFPRGFIQAPLLRNVKDLQQHLVQVDKVYDNCSSAWAQGEADKFTGEAFLESKPSHVYLTTPQVTAPWVLFSGSTLQPSKQ